MGVRKIKNSWWTDFMFNHERYRKRSPLNSKTGAEEYGEEFAGKWFKEYVIPNNKFSEQRSKKTILAGHLVPAFGNIPINKITTQHVDEFKSKQVTKGFKNKSINNQLTVLSKCLGTAQDWYGLQIIPNIKWLRCPPPKTDFLSHEECDLLLRHADGIWHEMILTALRTGQRRGELKALQWQNINWTNRTIAVRHTWCEVGKGLVAPKSNRERYIPLDAQVNALLYQRRKKLGFVFLNRNNHLFDTKTLSRKLKRISQKAGLRNVHWHMLRHTFASHLAMANAPLTAIQALLGHASIATTMRYAHLSPSTLRATIDLLGGREIRSNSSQPVVNRRHVLTI